MKPSISIIIPALNEESNIKATVGEVIDAIGNGFSDYELLIFNDGSSDNTGAIAEEIAAKNEKVKVAHNGATKGLGYSYKEGVELAEKDYIMMIPGDNQFPANTIKKMLDTVGKADIVVPFISNMHTRPMARRIASWGFTKMMNLLFNLDLSYYNGTVIHRKDVITPIPSCSNSFAYQAEILTKLIKSGHSYVEVGSSIIERQFGVSKAFSFSNTAGVLWAVIGLFQEVHLSGKENYRKPTKKIEMAGQIQR
ncbi:MAG: glycosyltransferase family 2 protein [Candidatus Brocadiales bacterium]